MRKLAQIAYEIIQRLLGPYFERQRILTASGILGLRNVNECRWVDLWDTELKVFSQWGEDGILDFLCHSLGIHKPKMLEFGAGNLTECNSRFLAENRNASVYAVDGRSDLLSTAKRLEIFWRNNVMAVQDWVTPENASHHLSKAQEFMGGIDVLSIDFDGNDYWILESLELIGIHIIVVEYNPIFGGKFPVSIPRDDDFDRTEAHYSWLYYGVSLRAWIDLLRTRQYTFVGTNRAGNNAFFIANSKILQIPLKVPLTDDISRYVDWRVRESRSKAGKLNYLSNNEALQQISSCKVINTKTFEIFSLSKLFEE